MKKGIIICLSVLFLLGSLSVVFAEGQGEAAGEKAWDLIDWDSPKSMADRVMGQGPVEDIPTAWNHAGVDFSGKKGMLSGYTLPDGWEEATEGVEKLISTNSGALTHDPATALNESIFEDMTGIELELIEMQDALLWPKSLSVAMAKSDDLDMFYATRSMLEIPHLSAAGWIHPTDDLWNDDVLQYYPGKMMGAVKGPDGHFYGTPYVIWGMFLFYRPSWLEGAGVDVPDTWQEMVPASKRVEEWAVSNLGHGHQGWVHAANDPDQIHQIWSMTVFSQDKMIVQPDGSVVMDKAAWDNMCAWWTEGGMSEQSLELLWSSSPEVFAKGKAGFILTGGVYMNMFKDPEFASAIEGDWAVTLLPAWEGVGKKGMAVAGNDSFMINTHIDDNQKAACMLWFDYIRSYQAQFNEPYVEGNESCVLDVYEHPDIIETVDYQDLRKETLAAQVGESYPPGMMEIIEVVKEYLHRVALGQMDADTAYAELSEQIANMQ